MGRYQNSSSNKSFVGMHWKFIRERRVPHDSKRRNQQACAPQRSSVDVKTNTEDVPDEIDKLLIRPALGTKPSDFSNHCNKDKPANFHNFFTELYSNSGMQIKHHKSPAQVHEQLRQHQKMRRHTLIANGLVSTVQSQLLGNVLQDGTLVRPSSPNILCRPLERLKIASAVHTGTAACSISLASRRPKERPQVRAGFPKPKLESHNKAKTTMVNLKSPCSTEEMTNLFIMKEYKTYMETRGFRLPHFLEATSGGMECDHE